MIKTSEYCAVGHPDRTCDYIASFILDRYLEHDARARVALEVQMKDCFVTVSGEVTSSWKFTNTELAQFVRDAVKDIGYTDEYVRRFGEGNCVSGDGLEVTLHISQQSRDIAQGVDGNGWGDQGIFWGFAVNDPECGNMPYDYYLARKLAQRLDESGLGGHDIKTQVTVEDMVRVTEVVVAIPLVDEGLKANIEAIVREVCGNEAKITINGTGKYLVHGSIGDCGTTGRKLVADFYGGNSKIGGGSPWGKDPTKADVSLNILARMKALEYLKAHDLREVQCAISCCIGRPEIRVTYFDGSNALLETVTEEEPPEHIIERLGLRYPHYAACCARGLFGYEG